MVYFKQEQANGNKLIMRLLGNIQQKPVNESNLITGVLDSQAIRYTGAGVDTGVEVGLGWCIYYWV